MQALHSLFTFLVWLLVIAIIMGWVFVKKYNLLQRQGHKVREAHSNVMVCMKKRLDLANKLVDIARSYGEHEKLAHITISQNTSSSIEHMSNTLHKDDASVTQMMTMIRNFPELKANQTYQQLMSQYDVIEIDLQKKRELYNAVVRENNTMLTQLPMSLFAAALGFRPAVYFDVDNADALENLKDFQTDDGSILKERLTQVGARVLDTSKALGTQAIQASKAIVAKAKETSSPSLVKESEDRISICTECGQKLSNTDKFCSGCGAKFTGTL